MAVVTGGIVAAIVAALSGLIGSFIARILIGAGLALVTYQGVSTGVDYFVAQFEAAFTGLPGNLLSLLAMAGVGEALSVIMSTAISVATIGIAGRVAGVRKA